MQVIGNRNIFDCNRAFIVKIYVCADCFLEQWSFAMSAKDGQFVEAVLSTKTINYSCLQRFQFQGNKEK